MQKLIRQPVGPPGTPQRFVRVPRRCCQPITGLVRYQHLDGTVSEQWVCGSHQAGDPARLGGVARVTFVPLGT